MTHCYAAKNFRRASLDLIDKLNEILHQYREQDLVLSVRQLFYQAVARALIENTERQYTKVINLVNDGRMAGLIDWDMIEDRTRNFNERQRWQSGEQILRAAADSYHEDMWRDQEYRVFAIIEKDALSAVISPTCRRFDVPLLAARGYPSVTALHEFAEEKINPAQENGQQVIILHLGDHDPSGLDMTRDLQSRLDTFCLYPVNVERIALNMNQIEELSPPPNPAKQTDKRFQAYRQDFGDSSWELDALPPEYMAALLEANIRKYIDVDAWQDRQHEIKNIQNQLEDFADAFQESCM